jgi:dihydroflavonol-4-reductase
VLGVRLTVSHCATAQLVRVNVEGKRIVMEEALRAGVERVVHTSSVSAVGSARPQGAVDERTPFPPGVGVPYADSKHAAETEALRVAARGSRS